MLRCSAVVCVVFVSLLALGCGSKGIKTDVVTGKVTFNGEALEGAAVRFSPAAGGSGNIAYGSTDKDGLYKLQTLLGEPDAGTTPGEYIVTVSKSFSVGTGKFQQNPDGTTYETFDPVEMLPDKYANLDKSELRFTVVAGKPNVYDIPLEGTLRTKK
jgi:hypothetical protein